MSDEQEPTLAEALAFASDPNAVVPAWGRVLARELKAVCDARSTNGLVAWNGSANEFWGAVASVRDHEDTEGDQAVLLEACELAMRQALYQQVEVPGPSARPSTLEKCWATIEYMDREVCGAMNDYTRFRRELEALKRGGK